MISSSPDCLSNITNSLASSISKQKDKLIFEVLSENNIDTKNLTNLSKNGRFLKPEGENYSIFNWAGQDLLIIYEPEITCEDLEFKVEVKYKKLYKPKPVECSACGDVVVPNTDLCSRCLHEWEYGEVKEIKNNG